MSATRASLRPARAGRLVAALAVASTLALALPVVAAAQATPRPMDGLRVGVTFGGIGLVSLTAEWIGENQAGLEASVGTWSFRDLSVAVGARGYFGGGYLRPAVGGGLWYIRSFDPTASGQALLLRAPLGIDWRASGEHFVGATVSATRALWVTRAVDEALEAEREDFVGIANRGRLVPLPALTWRWRP